MALNGKVRPDCNYASNPYHECTDNCLRRIAEGKGRKDKKKSDSGIVYNKKSEEKKDNRACHRASNPYHECNESCFKGTGAGREAYKPKGPANEIKSEGKRKMGEPRPTPRREIYENDNNNYSVSMPLASYFSPEKQNGERYSNEIQVEESSFDSNHAHSSRPVPTSVIPSKTDSSRDLPKESAKKQNDNDDSNNLVASASRSFSFSGVECSDDDDEDTRSEISDSSVSVGKYRVKGRLSPILQSIFEKYGDIGASCQLESVAMRSYYLECVCFVVQELQITQPQNATKSKVKEMLAILKDVEASGIDVAWLRRVLDENVEAMEKIGKYKEIEDSIANCDMEMKSARKKLESEMASLALIEKETEEAKKRIEETRARLKELELKYSVLNESFSSIKSKVENGKSLLDGVL